MNAPLCWLMCVCPFLGWCEVRRGRERGEKRGRKNDAVVPLSSVNAPLCWLIHFCPFWGWLKREGGKVGVCVGDTPKCNFSLFEC